MKSPKLNFKEERKMKRNIVKTGIGIGVGITLIATSAVMGMAKGPSGYDTLKQAFKNSKKIENATMNISGTLVDNNKELVKIMSTVKGDEKNSLFSGTFAIDSEKIDKSYVAFGTEGQMVFKDSASNVYNRMKCEDEKMGRRQDRMNREYDNPQMEELGEKIMDALVGDLKKQVTQKQIGNNETQISINLEKNEIPALFNLVLSAKHDKNHDQECEKSCKMHELLGISKSDIEFPELEKDISAEKVDVQIVVDKNHMIKSLDFEFDVTGKDVDNKVHDQELNLSIDVTGINSTKPDTIDMSGKEVKDIDCKDFECERR